MNGGNVLAFMANHVWQSTVFGVLAAGLAFMLRANHARVRYWLWVTASIKFLVPFAVFASIGSYAHRVKPVALTPPATVVTLMQWHEPFSVTMPEDAFDVPSKTVRLPQKSASAWPTGLIILWLSGGLFVAASSYSRWRRFATVVHAARPIPAGREADVLQRVQQEFRLSSPIRLVTSESMIEPGLFGIMAPILLLPIGLRERITDLQLEAIFAHELCHARRRDNLWAAVHMAVEALFWFHPGVWWLGSRLIEERELSCDEEVLRCGCAPDVYAKAMVEICKSYLAAPVKCISGVTGSDLRRRIEVVMKNGIAQRLAVGKRILIVTFGTVAVCGPIAIGFLNVQQNSAQFLSASLSAATLVRGETSQQTGTAVGNVQAQTALVTARPSVFQASSAPQGPQDIKAEQGNEKSECEQPGDQALLLQRAKDLGFDGYGDAYVRTAMERWRQQLDLPTMEALEQDLVSRGLNPDEVKEKMRVMVLTSRVERDDFQSQVQYPTYKDIRRYYDEHAQDFNRPAGVHVREITILTGNREPEQIERQRKKAEAALEAVKRGADFAAVAARFSESLTAQVSGGDMGFSVKGRFGELEEVIDKLEQGEVSDIIQVDGAFMIIKADYVHLGGVLPFELVQKEIIKAILSRQSNKPDWCEYLAKLRTNGRR